MNKDAKVLFEVKEIHGLDSRIIQEGDRLFVDLRIDFGPDGFQWERDADSYPATSEGYAEALRLVASTIKFNAESADFYRVKE